MNVCSNATVLADERAKSPRVGLFNEAALGVDEAAVKVLGAALSDAGAPARIIGADALCDSGIVNRTTLDVLVLPMGPAYPVPAMDTIEDFLRNGGGVIFLGGPPLSAPFQKQGGEWLEREMVLRKGREAEKHVDAGGQLYPLFDFTKGDPGDWQRNSNAQQAFAGIGTQKAALDGGKDALLIHVANLTGWDLFTRPVTFPFGTKRLYIRAKGDARTPQLAIELAEADGSRWMATVTLTETCETFVLDAAEFKFWGDATDARGQPGEVVQFHNVSTISLGLAISRTGVEKGERRIWIQELGGDVPCVDVSPPPREIAVDGLGPRFRLFPVTNVDSVRVNPAQALVREAAMPA